ncbi:MAG: hypothetical protein ACXVEF_41300 [Polyangiales bacterium]
MRSLAFLMVCASLAGCAGDDPIEETEDTGTIIEGGADDSGAPFDSTGDDTGEDDTGMLEDTSSGEGGGDASSDAPSDGASDTKPADASSDTPSDAADAISTDVLLDVTSG